MKMEEGSSQGFDRVWSNPFGMFVLNVWVANINALQYPPFQHCSCSHKLFLLDRYDLPPFHTDCFIFVPNQ